jgi:hypothetical protein
MGSKQSSLTDSFDSVNISFTGYNRNPGQRFISITRQKPSSLSTLQHFDDNLSTTSTNLSIVSLSQIICQSRSFDLQVVRQLVDFFFFMIICMFKIIKFLINQSFIFLVFFFFFDR